MTFSKLGRLLISVILLSAIFAPISGAAPLVRSTLDRPDEVSGYQIHLVYVVTKGGIDEQRDLNGQIDNWVNESQTWLQNNSGHQLIFDSYQGQVDVTFLQSKYSKSELCFDTCDTLYKLADEIRNQDPNLAASKTLYFNLSELLDPGYCGWANGFGNLSLGFNKGDNCNDSYSASFYGLSSPAKTLIHEVFHTFGVNHVCSIESDIMIGSPECDIKSPTFGQLKTTVDLSRKNYLGGDLAGIDISKLPIWTDGSGSKEYAKLSPTSGNFYIPKLSDGTVVVRTGEVSGSFAWLWSKQITTYFEKVTCTLTSGDKKLTGVAVKNSCVFAVPPEWRPGSDFTITQDIAVGPYFGTASVSGKIARANYSITPCTTEVCVEGGSVAISGYCWSPNVERLVLEQLIEGIWQEVQSKKTEVGSGCGSENPMNADFTLKFDSVGTKIYRMVVPGSTKDRIYMHKPFAILVTTMNVAEPSASEISKAQEDAVTQGKQADAKEAVELKAKKEAEAKALADKIAADKVAAEKLATEQAAADKKAQEEKAVAAKKIAEEKATEVKIITGKAAADKLIADKAAGAAKAAAAKKITITCVKGKLTKKVTAVKPVCPSGYKKN
jgi:hypothetical protein